MPLAPGSRLGPYEIVAPLGVGGMGEVYRARDTRLDRVVAIKVLPDRRSANPDLRARFEREARAISSLAHPNICAVFDVGQFEGGDFLVMEHLEGESLADRVLRGALPLDQVFRVGREIASALDRAHRQGIVHRDLKPGNVMLTKTGAKLLDFGVAKLALPDPPSVATRQGGESTVTPLTGQGMILGTPQYMAPEQLEGQPIDARADIFGLGALLYEMATGRRAFDGASQASIIAAVLGKDPPPVSTLQPMTPPAFDRLVRTCLAKDPEERWQSAHDVAAQLAWIAEGGSQIGVAPPVAARRRIRERWSWVALAVATGAVALLGAALIARRAEPPAPAVVRARVELAPETPLDSGIGDRIALAPDGRRIVFVGRTGESTRLFVRALDQLSSTPLAGSDGAQQPFFSPDGQWIGFFADGRLKKASLAGGSPVVTLCESGSDPRGGTWNSRGDIVFAGVQSGGLRRVPAAGGAPVALTELDPKRNERSHRWPKFAPDGRSLVFTVQSGSQSFDDGILERLDLATGERTRLWEGGSAGALVARDRLAFVRAGSLYVVQPGASAAPLLIAQGVGYDPRNGGAQFSAAPDGTLAYLDGHASAFEGPLGLVDRAGKPAPLVERTARYLSPRFSPDGRQLALQIGEPGHEDLWIYDFGRGSLSRSTFGDEPEVGPVWTPDGQRIAFAARRAGHWGLYWKRADGAGDEERLLELPAEAGMPLANSFTPDGRALSFQRLGAGTRSDLWLLDLAARQATPLVASPSSEVQSMFSPDGRWFAYVSDESGVYEVLVRSFPDRGGRWQVSIDGGDQPRWSGDGRELFYREFATPRDQWFAVPVESAGASWASGSPRRLFDTWFRGDPNFDTYDVDARGERFAMPLGEAPPTPTQVVFVFHWDRELAALATGGAR
jgi:serine/threonine-protein kinase